MLVYLTGSENGAVCFNWEKLNFTQARWLSARNLEPGAVSVQDRAGGRATCLHRADPK